MANNQLKEELILSTKQFDKRINEVLFKVEELKKRGAKVGSGFDSSFGKMIQRATGFNGSLSSLLGAVSKFAGGLGLAIGASEVFNKTINSSQILTDEYGSVQQSVTTVVDSFFQSLANGDFSNFLNGMDSMIGKAKEAYNTMDDLWNMAQSFSVQNARLNNQFQQNLNEIRQKKSSTDPTDQQRVKELTEKNKEIIKQQAEGGVKLYKQTIKGLQEEIASYTNTNFKVSESIIYRIVENDINNLKQGREKYEKEYKEYTKKQQDLYEKYSTQRAHGGLIDKVASRFNPQANLGTEYQKELNVLQEKYSESITANYLLQRKSDEQLNEFNNKLKQGISYQGVAIANQSKMLRYTKETNEETEKANTKTTKATKATNTIKHVAVYKEDAKTVQEISDNIEVLNKQLKNTIPNTAEYKQVSKEIETWKLKLEVVDVDDTAKSIKAISNNISILQNKLNKIEPNTVEFKTVSDELNKWENKLEETTDYIVNLKFKDNATTIKDINTNISILNSRLNNTVKGSQDWLALTKQIREESAKLKDYQGGSLSDLQNQISEIEQRLSNENLSLSARIELIDKKSEIQSKIDAITDDSYIKVKQIVGNTKRQSNSISNAQTNINRTVDLYDSGIIDYKAAKAEIEQINQELLKIGAKPIKVHLETDTERLFADIEYNATAIIGGFEGIDNVINDITQLSESIYEGANAWQTFIGVLESGLSVIQALSDIINTVNTLTEIFGTTQTVAAEQTAEAAATEVAAATTVTTAKSGEAIAGATASGAKMPFPLNLVAIAAGIAAVVSALALVGSFANGGVVGGSSYAGDNLIARVNSGEMILNSREQKNLFNLLDKGSTNGVSSGNVNFVIRGKDLYGVLNNYNNKMDKVR